MSLSNTALFTDQSIPRSSSFQALVNSLATPNGGEWSYQHSVATDLDIAPGRLVRNVTLFGVGEPHAVFSCQAQRMAEVTTVALRDVLYSGNSTVVQSLKHGFYEPSVRAIWAGGGPALLSKLEPFYSLKKDQVTLVPANLKSVECIDKIAIPICGSGFHNYGHFFLDGLPAALQYSQALPSGEFRLVGNHLAEWQKDILHGLGLLPFYHPVTSPVLFSKAIVSNMLAQHLPYPTRNIRPVFDKLRFLHGSAERRERIVFLSRRSDTSRRLLVNRREVEAALENAGVEIHHPEQMTLQEQIALASSSRLIIGELGAAMCNIGFCDPGASVLDIQQEGYPDIYVRSMCHIMGLKWHLYVAEVDHARMAARTGETPHCIFRVDVKALMDAIRTITDRENLR
ncbi:glycosyltransferase 61 family protein [Variovorax sp. J2P1-59]|uniref:glycosyltransferase family 61 protein n=1 Tax=Variovorax flavidus TaxID=3053501 RepID=UPI0025781F6A|nr:glycosyltransferase 61 family protein [Variovorax sp. J2P1-59]MDM0077389.1 glycosyltransferase 61 family protein [Variovorax sp. J2P1-59]